MAPPKEKEAVVMLLDIGKNMQQTRDGKKTYFELSRECLSQIVRRKLMSESLDEFALILFGCSETKNKLASMSDKYENIAVISELAKANWNFLRTLDDLNVNSNDSADWVYAVNVALRYIKDETEYRTFDRTKIVIFSNFESSFSEDRFSNILNEIVEMNIDVVVIGPDTESEAKTDGQILINTLIDSAKGTLCSFDDAAHELKGLQRKAVNPAAWNVLLTISSQIKIPISAYKKISPIAPLKWKSEAVRWSSQVAEANSSEIASLGSNASASTGTSVIRESAYIKLADDKESEIEVLKENVINGYQFGSTIIPFGESEENMKYESGPRGLYLIKCTPKENVPFHLLVGTGSYLVGPKKDDETASTALNAFIEALHQEGLVGIAKRVYTHNSAPTIVALFPVVTEQHRYLTFSELPFAEDEHVFKFRNFSDVNLSDEQKNVVDDLIDSINLDETEEEEEKFAVTGVRDPYEQFRLECICFKAMYPNKPLPEHLPSISKEILNSNSEDMTNYQPILKRLKEEFPLYRVEPKKKRMNGAVNGNSDSGLLQISANDTEKKHQSPLLLDGPSAEVKPNVEETVKLDIENVALKQTKEEDSFYGSLESTNTLSQDLLDDL